MDWEALREAKDAEIEQLASLALSEVTPSIRAFGQYVTTRKQELAFIAGFKRTDPQTGHNWANTDLRALAQACDDAEIGAIGVYTEPSVFGTSLKEMRAVSAAVTAPVLRLDLIIHPRQIHQARLYGADAVLLCASACDTETLASLVTEASSSHVTPVVVVETPSEVEQALTAGAFIVALNSPSATIDMQQIETLTRLIPPQKTVIVVDEVSADGERARDECAALQGKVDAVMVGNLLLDAPDVEAVLASLSEA